jgi:flagellar biosynthesis/type III secretory pathway chaperone
MRIIEAIKTILLEQIEGCRQLLEILQRERFCLMDLHLEGVEAVTKEKDIQVLKLKLLEKERERLLDSLSQRKAIDFLQEGRAPDLLSLQRLALLTGDTSFSEMRSKLISLSQSIKELNDLNKIMIDRTLGYLRKNNQFLGLITPGSVTAGSKGVLLYKEL